MKLVSPQEFLPWALTRDIAPDPRYKAPQCLVYVPYRAYCRFWNQPTNGGAIPYFLGHVLAGLDPWSACYAWPRGGRWPEPRETDYWAARVRTSILLGADIPPGFPGAVRYEAGEAGSLVTVATAQTLFGSNAADDLFIVLDHGEQFLWIDHHDVVHVEFAEEGRVAPFVRHMASKGFELPVTVPVGRSNSRSG